MLREHPALKGRSGGRGRRPVCDRKIKQKTEMPLLFALSRPPGRVPLVVPPERGEQLLRGRRLARRAVGVSPPRRVVYGPVNGGVHGPISRRYRIFIHTLRNRRNGF